jgi:hypothetical protein
MCNFQLLSRYEWRRLVRFRTFVHRSKSFVSFATKLISIIQFDRALENWCDGLLSCMQWTSLWWCKNVQMFFYMFHILRQNLLVMFLFSHYQNRSDHPMNCHISNVLFDSHKILTRPLTFTPWLSNRIPHSLGKNLASHHEAKKCHKKQPALRKYIRI